MASEHVERKLAAILAADIAGYSRLSGADEEGTMRRLCALRIELIDPAIQVNRGRIVKTTGDGILVEFISVVDAVRCSLEIQRGLAVRNADFISEKRIGFRIGIHLGDVMVQADGDLLGDGVNIAARLEGIAEPGGICLSDDAYRQVRDRLKEEFTDLGDKELKNIARPVRVYSVKTGSDPSPPEPHAAAPGKSGPPRLSIVVLPFVNLGGDPEQEYFVDGVTESLTTDLSRIRGAFVIAHNSALAYKAKPVDTRQIGRELGVRYVMEGSMQSIGSRIRVNAQLIDAETGAHLWAERFDKLRADLFDMQDEITARLARMIGIELVEAEGRRAERERPDNMDAMDLAMRGWAIINQPSSLDDVRRARAHFEAALRLDDANIDALVGLAESYTLEGRSYASHDLSDLSEHMRTAEAATAKALRTAPNNALAHYVRATVLHRMRAPERALRECELAIGLDQNLALAHAYAGFMKVLLGRPEETEAHIAEAIRLSPRDPQLSRWYFFRGAADLYLGRIDDAVEPLQKAAELHPNHNLNHFFLAAALALLSREVEAAEACAAGQRLDPTFSVARFRELAPSNNPVYLALRERVYDGMRKAGVPEG
ncbi:adenylate/guanylate cyclase domain-containing protein [Paraburkholderia sp. CI3]|uniref:adenylate/guanylate cyclase domain-containing protein n=1 Tax=Paraburkholderia sp. CI3 TaxID=2991060 RepID=UPI003D24E442